MIRFLLGLSLFSILACADKSGECPTVFFGGEIVNPTSDYVVLYRNDTYIDSVKLDPSNRFAFNLQGIDEGLYHFDHSPEQQYLYLQEGDSILIRLNTMEFDESLVFSGIGSDINNFMVEMFLAHEQENRLVYDMYKDSPEDFHAKIDSLRQVKIVHLNEIVVDHPLTEKMLSMAHAAIDYESYIYLEKYPYYHKKKTGEETFHELGDAFYDYRNNVDLNAGDLAYFRPYFEFMKYYFGNLSYRSCMEICGGVDKAASKHLHFNKHKLKLVDSLVREDDLRNILFRNIAMDYLLKEHNPSQECRVFIDKFRMLSTSDGHKEEITHLYEGIQKLQPKNALPDVMLTNFNNEQVSIKDISKQKNTVFYFWSASQKRHFKLVNQRIAELKKMYPKHHFVGINLRTGFQQWRELVVQSNMDSTNQYYGQDFKDLQMAMVIDDLNKCIITKDTIVEDAFANLYTSFSK